MGIIIISCEKCDPEPSLSTNEAQSISSDSAELSGTISLSECSLSVTSQGIVYSRNNNFPTTSDSKIQINSESPSVIVNSLAPASLYYFRTYLSNLEGDFYGNVEEFNTPIGPAQLNNVQITLKRAKYINVRARISSLGGGSIIRSGFELSTNNDFTENNRVLNIQLLESNINNHTISSLNPNTTYFIRSFIENESGITNSEINSFSTLSGVVVYEDKEFSNVGKRSANFSLTLVDDGGIDIQEWGFTYANGSNWFYGARRIKNIIENENITHRCIAQNPSLILRVKPYYIEVGESDRVRGDQLSVKFSPENHNLQLSLETLNFGDVLPQGWGTLGRIYDNIYTISGGSLKIHAKNFGVIWKRSDGEWNLDYNPNYFIFWRDNQIIIDENQETIDRRVRLGAEVNENGDKYLPSFNVGFDYQFRVFLFDHDDDLHYSNTVNISIPE